jgi:outer membrane protein assembly factor BamE (lipoprotein component of BamABCDE complex)
MKRTVRLLLGVALVGSMAGCAAPGGAGVSGGADSAVTMAKYSQVKEGMTYEQVVAVMGSPGEENVRTKVGDVEMAQYTWKTSTGAMVVSFENNKVKVKAQSGLK